MKIFKTAVQHLEDGSLSECDTIEYRGKLWLVPEWLEVPSRQKTIPTRIIGMDRALFLKPPPAYPVDFLLSCPMPKCVFDGQIPIELEGKVVSIERPELEISAGGGLH